MKILLIFPPQAQPFLPHLALPALQAFIRADGRHRVEILDVNLESYEYFLSGRFLQNRDSAFMEAIENSKNELRRKTEQFSPSSYYSAISSLHEGLEEVGKRYPGATLTLKDFKIGHSISASEQIIRATKDHLQNPYIGFFEREVIPGLKDKSPDIIGISISWPSQIIPGFTLSRMIKSALPGTHVTIGGSMTTHLGDFLIHKRKFFDLCHSFILYEGEIALLELANVLESRGKLEDVPGLIYPQGKKNVGFNKQKIPETLKTLPAPDFEGLPLDRYYSPGPYLPIAASRSCYWQRCSFCGHSYSSSHYRMRPVQMIFEDMLHLHETTGARHFYFVDDAIPPPVLDRLPMLIKESGKPFYWGGEIRFEKRMLKTDFSLAREAGCRFLLFGLESYCQRVLDLMNKGVDRNIVIPILRKSHEAGIINWVFIFVGFPGETAAEARATLDFITDNGSIIDVIAPGQFVLTRHSRVYQSQESYGMKKVESPSMEYDMMISFRYLPGDGPMPDELTEMLNATKTKPGFFKFLKPFITEVHMMFLEKSHYSSEDFG